MQITIVQCKLNLQVIFFTMIAGNNKKVDFLTGSKCFWSENLFRCRNIVSEQWISFTVTPTRVTSHAPRWKAHSIKFWGVKFSRASEKRTAVRHFQIFIVLLSFATLLDHNFFDTHYILAVTTSNLKIPRESQMSKTSWRERIFRRQNKQSICMR
jgi:hypothetical protein